MDETIEQKQMLVMKLLHYFITEKNYNPIILQGAENEIWLENLDSDYKIVRIVSNHIHNNEQLDFDYYKTKNIVKKIKRKTFSFNVNVLSIFTDLGDFVKEDSLNTYKNITCIDAVDEKSIYSNDSVKSAFPDMNKKLKFTEDGMQLFLKITSDINKKNKKNQDMAEDIFSKKVPIVTYILLAINIIVYLVMMVTKSSDYIISNFGNNKYFVIYYKQFYRLITSAFIHSPKSIFHIIFNSYALYILGSQLESFMGKTKYIIIYFYSIIAANLLSLLLNDIGIFTIGASGAIFGILGSLLYFGYHYRVYLGSVIKSQIIPIIVINLGFGFLSNDIDNFAHIGGLIGGILITSAVGVKYKSSKIDIINGIITSILFILIMLFLTVKFVAKI